jgi:AAA15 family ATPase/GTPase
MLLSFTLKNFRSFADEQEFSMVASNKYPDHREHLCRVPNSDESVLRTAIIYGANGSGKSNLIKALSFIQLLVITGTQPGKAIARQPFLFDVKAGREPSRFQLRFIQNELVFDYGFLVTDTEISEEWLFLLRGAKETSVFERTTKEGQSKIDPGPGMTETQYGDHSKAAALARIGVRGNQLFLAAVRDGLNAADHGPLIQAVLEWIGSIVIVMPNANFNGLAQWVANNVLFTDFAGRFLRDASTGVAALRMDNQELDEKSGLPLDFAKQVLSDAQPGEVRQMQLPGLGNVFLQKGVDQKILLQSIRAEHQDSEGRAVMLPLQEESDGTQRLTHLLPALFQLQDERRIYVIDEIDRSLHPLLAKKFIEFFLRACSSKKGQLVVTTHESNLMDLDLLRRDELWFTEKSLQGISSLYSLADFKVRTDLKIDKGYLQGRFGAIPFLGNLDRLAEETAAPTEPAWR